MGIYAAALTDRGMELAQRLSKLTGGDIETLRCADTELFSWTEEHFVPGGALIFVCAAEDAVRAIAPFLKQRAAAPSVIAIDESGKFVIPLISGDGSKANALACAIADCLGGTAVISAAASTENVFAVDKWAASIGLRIANPEKVKDVTAKLSAGGQVSFSSVFPIGGALPEGVCAVSDKEPSDFTISYLTGVPGSTLCLVPPVLTLGVDCAADVSAAQLEAAYVSFMENCGCSALAVFQLCAAERLSGSEGLSEFCREHKLKARFFSAADFAASDAALAADNICERSAVLGSGGSLLVRKTSLDGVTMALAVREPKA